MRCQKIFTWRSRCSSLLVSKLKKNPHVSQWLYIVSWRWVERLGCVPIVWSPTVHACTTNDGTKRKRGPIMVAWYFCMFPHVHRFFANAKSPNMIRWHGEEQRRDRILRHPVDASQWRTIYTMFYNNIDKQLRLVLFGFSTYGMNPFDMVWTNHSTRPMMLYTWNLPPWLCMKRLYIMMLILIQGQNNSAMASMCIWNLWSISTKDVEQWYSSLGHVQKRAIHGERNVPHYHHRCEETKVILDVWSAWNIYTDVMWFPNNNKMVHMGHRMVPTWKSPLITVEKKSFDRTRETWEPPCFLWEWDMGGSSKLYVVPRNGKG